MLFFSHKVGHLIQLTDKMLVLMPWPCIPQLCDSGLSQQSFDVQKRKRKEPNK